MSGCRPGVAVAWALRVLVVSAIILDCVLAFGKSALHLPPWGHTLLLLLTSIVFLLSLLVLGAHQQQRRQDAFQVLPPASTPHSQPSQLPLPLPPLPWQDTPGFTEWGRPVPHSPLSTWRVGPCLWNLHRWRKAPWTPKKSCPGPAARPCSPAALPLPPQVP